MAPDLADAVLRLSWLARPVRAGLHASAAAEADPSAPATLVTCVAIPPPPIGARLAAIAQQLDRVDGRHHPYPLESLHCTVSDLADLPSLVGRASADVEATAERLSGIGLEVVGLGLSPSTVFAAVRATDRRLAAERRALRRAWNRPVSLGRRLWEAGGIFHVNVLRFRAAPSDALLEAVRDRRNERLGPERLTEFRLVRTNKVMAAARTTTLRSAGVPD